jgi:hypothetical protein
LRFIGYLFFLQFRKKLLADQALKFRIAIPRVLADRIMRFGEGITRKLLKTAVTQRPVLEARADGDGNRP